MTTTASTTSTSTAPRAARSRRRAGRALVSLLLVVIGVIMIAPLIWLVVTSLTEPSHAFAVPPNWLPIPFSTANYEAIDDLIPLGRMVLNSVLVALASITLSLLFSVLAAYGFSRLPFRGSRGLMVVLLSALMVPVQLTIIPVFVLMRGLALVDDIAALWLPTLINVFQIFFLRQYFNSIPRELDEAARVDGAGHLWILFRMIVPLSGPAIAALAILAFEASWNNFFGALIFLSSPENMTLPVGLVLLSDVRGGVSAAVIFAAITLVTLPVLIFFIIFQNKFVSSIATVGIRG